MGLEAALCLAALLWVILVIPESFSRDERKKRAAGKPKGFQETLQGLRIFFGRIPQYSAWKLWVAVALVNLPLLLNVGNILISVYFLKAPPFDASASVIGNYQAIWSICQGTSVTLVLFSFSVALRMSDSVSALVSVSFQLTANTLMGFAKTSTQVYFIAVVQGVEAISWTAGRSLLSKLVSSNDQGAMFSVVASVESVMFVICSVLFPLFYPMTLQPYLPTGLIYWIMAAIDTLAYPLLIALIVSEVLQWRKQKSSTKQFGDKQKEKKFLLANGHQTLYQST